MFTSRDLARYAQNTGLRLVDATEVLRLFLGAGDIAKAKPLDPSACAFTIACRRTNPKIVATYFFKSRGSAAGGSDGTHPSCDRHLR